MYSLGCRGKGDHHLAVVYRRQIKGPSIKYSTSRYFWPILTPSPCHTLSHIPGPPKSTSHISDPTFLEGLVQKTRTKAPCTNSLSIILFAGVYVWGFLRGLLSGRFCPGWFLCVPPSVRIHLYYRKLSITLNFRFHMYDKKIISVTSQALDHLPLSQTDTPSRIPSPLKRDVLYERPLCTHLPFSYKPCSLPPAFSSLIHLNAHYHHPLSSTLLPTVIPPGSFVPYSIP